MRRHRRYSLFICEGDILVRSASFLDLFLHYILYDVLSLTSFSIPKPIYIHLHACFLFMASEHDPTLYSIITPLTSLSAFQSVSYTKIKESISCMSFTSGVVSVMCSSLRTRPHSCDEGSVVHRWNVASPGGG